MRACRRVVTGHNGNGQSVVLHDGPPPRTIVNLAEVWMTEATPASNRGDGDAGVGSERLAPPAGGTVFRYFRVPPESRAASLDPAARAKAVRERFAAMQAEDALVDTRRHPAMHRTRTVDYVVLLSGRVTLLLDDGEVELEPFDAVVQRGTNHAWVNHGEEPALLVAVLIDAEPLPL